MKILIAPNSFKESLTSIEVARCIARGLKKASRRFKIMELPLADGGTGTAQIITKAFDGEFIRKKVSGPLDDKVTASYGVIKEQGVAVIELAEAAGLRLVPNQKRTPLNTTTAGVGELVRDAIERGYYKIILGIGDSATIDCGVGALSILGVKFLDAQDQEISHNCRGLLDLKKIETSAITRQVRRTKITVASDVKNILTGRYGALVYAKQKGAKRKDMPLILKALRNFKRVIAKQFDINLDKIPGSGAAGGIGGAFAALLNAQILSGFGFVQEIVRLEDEIKTSDLIITGEGRVDQETFYGKTLKNVIDMAYIYRKPVILIAGRIASDVKILKRYHVLEQYSLIKTSRSVKKAISDAPKLLENIAYRIGRDLLLSSQ